MNEGDRLRLFIDNQPASKISIAKALNVTKQTLFQYFKSRELSPETKEKFERYFGKKIFDGAPPGQQVNTDHKKEDRESRDRLELTLLNLSEDKIRSTAIIERLVTLLEKEKAANSGGQLTSAEGLHTSGTPAGIHPPPIDLVLDKKYKKGK